MSTRAVVVVVGNPRPGSRTSTVATETGRRIADGGELIVIELADLASGLFDMSSTEVRDAVQAVCGADVIVVASPTYKATYTGLLKAFFDRFGGDALHGVLAVPVMIAAAAQHAMAVEVMLRPLLVEVGASLPTRGLFVQESQLGELDEVLDAWCAANLPLLARATASQPTSHEGAQ